MVRRIVDSMRLIECLLSLLIEQTTRDSRMLSPTLRMISCIQFFASCSVYVMLSENEDNFPPYMHGERERERQRRACGWENLVHAISST